MSIKYPVIGEPLLAGSFHTIVSDVDFAWTFTEVTVDGGAAGVIQDANIPYGPAPAALTAYERRKKQ